ncbi:MAG TPA: hypothetical protein VEX60_00815 [Pyrinomonadaceae bacterium]|nr:hypothetical protein [Pyrinomonadaceae bacterium]
MKAARNTSQQGAPSLTVIFAARSLVLFAFLALSCVEALAQTATATPPQEDAAPPPMRHIPDAVRKQLAEERDLKSRTRLSLALAEATIARSAECVAAERFEQATGELGVYEAIVVDVIRFVHSSGPVKNKQRDLFKRIEMTLRAHVPRLETIRRSLPERHAVYVKTTIKFIQEQRDSALNAFYDDTVIPDSRQTGDKPPASERAKGTTPAPPDTEKKPDQR